MKTLRYNVRLAIYWLMTLVLLVLGFWFETVALPFRWAMIVGGLILLVLHYELWNTERPCGHGSITWGRGGLVAWPFVVNPCPTCGDDLNYPPEG